MQYQNIMEQYLYLYYNYSYFIKYNIYEKNNNFIKTDIFIVLIKYSKIS